LIIFCCHEDNKTKTSRKYVCPNFKMKTGVYIIYGMPSIELEEQGKRGGVALGACCIGPEQPDRICLACDHEWRIVRRTVHKDTRACVFSR
jgi:hypothetical protein